MGGFLERFQNNRKSKNRVKIIWGNKEQESKDGKARERGVSMFQEMEETFSNKEIHMFGL